MSSVLKTGKKTNYFVHQQSLAKHCNISK